MWRKVFSLIITLSLVFQQVGFASMAVELNLAGHLSKMSSNMAVDRFRPVHIRFFSFDMLNDNIKVMLDKGDLKAITKGELNQSTQELLNYFLVGVTLPNDTFWVNLRPDSENNIIDEWLAKTDVGKIMLEADLQLKKDTARFTSPETIEGKEYWSKLYQKAEELYGYQEVTIPTLIRPWIVPNEIIVRETKDSSYIYKATLKVMQEQDVLKGSDMYSFKDERSKALNEYSSELIRELIIPKLTKEVNLSKRYSALRQVYYSLIFSRWFKSRFANQAGKYASLIDKKDLTRLTSISAWTTTSFFDAYKKSFSQGEYNVKGTVRTPTGQVIRSYFSGGMNFAPMVINGATNTVGSPIVSALKTAGLFTPEGMAIETASSPIKVSQFKLGYEPEQKTSEITRQATTETAVILSILALRGAALGLDSKKDKVAIKEIKDVSDVIAKRIYEQLIKENIILRVRVSEGFGRDEVADSFVANEVIIPDELRAEIVDIHQAVLKGLDVYQSKAGKKYQIKDAILDVIEGTNAFVTNAQGQSLSEMPDFESGATSVMVTGKGVGSLGNCPDIYADGIFTIVPEAKKTEFKNNPLDTESTAKDPRSVRNVLSRIAEANGISINDLEVVLMDRTRETERLAVLKDLQKEFPQLQITTIKDGTVAHGLLSVFGRKAGKHKVVMTVGGAPEVFMNLAVSGIFKDLGAVASVRVYSKNVNKTTDGQDSNNLEQRYAFSEEEKSEILNLRPSDGKQIISGDKLFTQEDVKGAVEGSFAFITNNGVFNVAGAKELENGDFQVTVLRVSNTSGTPDVWFEDVVISKAEIEGLLIPALKALLSLTTDSLKQLDIELKLKELRGKQQLASLAMVSKPIGMQDSRAFYEKLARQGNVIAMSTNVRSDFVIRGLLRAAKEIGAPVNLQRSISEFVQGYTPADLARNAQKAAELEGYTGDWMLKLDHGTVKEDTEKEIQSVIAYVKAAKEAGFGSFSIDASKLVDFSKPTVAEQQKRNIEVTARIVKETGIEDTAWEGEIGEIVGGHKALSTPEEAVTFLEGIEKQGVKLPVLLAINNGSEHGNKPGMKISLETTKNVFEAINARWGIHINQHGITGTALELFPELAQVGIKNGNVGTHWQNIAWEVIKERRPEIVAEALETLKLDGYRTSAWDSKIRNFEPRLHELLDNDADTLETITAAVYKSALEHFKAFGAKSTSSPAVESMASSAVAAPSVTGMIGRLAYDSRAAKTIEFEVDLEKDGIKYNGSAKVPAGASTGEREAWINPDFVKTANEIVIPRLYKAIKDSQVDITSQKSLANWLKKLDSELGGSTRLEKLGGNVVLAVCWAFADAVAKAKSLPLYQYWMQEYGEGYQPYSPEATYNILNAGAHGSVTTKVDTQETQFAFLGQLNAAQQNALATKVNTAMKNLLKKKGLVTTNGDEGGYSPEATSNMQYVLYLIEAIKSIKDGPVLGKDIALAFDFASTGFFKDGFYYLRGESGPIDLLKDLGPAGQSYFMKLVDQGVLRSTTIGESTIGVQHNDNWMENEPGIKLQKREWLAYVQYMMLRAPAWSLEDVCAENDWQSIREITRLLEEDRDFYEARILEHQATGFYNGRRVWHLLDDSTTSNPDYALLALEGSENTEYFTRIDNETIKVNRTGVSINLKKLGVTLKEDKYIVEPYTANAFLLKFNQIGTPDDTFSAAEQSLNRGALVSFSHRSGSAGDWQFIHGAYVATTFRHNVSTNPNILPELKDGLPRVNIKAGNITRERGIIYHSEREKIERSFSQIQEKKIRPTMVSKPIGMQDSRAFYEKLARQGNVIAMSTNVRSDFVIRGLLRAAKEIGAPVNLQRSISEFVQGYTPADLARNAQKAAELEGYTGDWMLKLDHGTVKEDTEKEIQSVIAYVKAAKEAGFGSFSIDASKLVDFSKPTVAEQQKRNIEVTARIVKETGIEDTAWEGEIGEIVGGHKALSTPEEAVTFLEGIEKQGVKLPVLLAINNGSEHGNKPGMKISLETTKNVFEAINARWGIHINQHGITGTALELFPELAQVGIKNGNVGTHWQNIAWEVIKERRPEIVAEALETLKLDGYRTSAWDSKIRNFEPRLHELLDNDADTLETITAAVYKSALEHFKAFGAKSTSSPAVASSTLMDGRKGGIDFRPAAMPINYQPMGNFASLNLDLPKLSQEELAVFDVDKELAGLETMVEREILPSGERIKEVLAASSQKGEMEANRERMMALLVKVGILEETQCCLQEASQGYKEALVLADSLT